MTDDTSREMDPDWIQKASDEFDFLTLERHEAGAEEYGSTAFMKNPLLRMAAEELADFANYARYTYIRLRWIEEVLNASGIDLSTGTVEEIRRANEVSFDSPTFIPGTEVSGFLPESESGGGLPDS